MPKQTREILIDEGKKPFVLFRDLGNHAVTYETNAYIGRPNELFTIKSELIDNIFSNFNSSKGRDTIAYSHRCEAISFNFRGVIRPRLKKRFKHELGRLYR